MTRRHARGGQVAATAAVAGWLLVVAHAAPARAQEAPIADNSFLVEEAYNQEPRVVQHVFTYLAVDDGPEWAATFTQEWPAPNQRHQLSYTVAHLDGGAGAGWGDLALNYRWQVRGFDDDPVAVAPRLSLLLATGNPDRELGFGAPGLQVNLPVSAELGKRWVSHSNAGGTWVPDAEASDGSEVDASAVTLAQSFVWLARPKLNLLLEATWTSAKAPAPGGGTVREESLLVSPGVRFAIDLASGLQVVPGIAVPIGVGASSGERSIFFYLSFEHPF